MEPLIALSLAGNILQFIHTTRQLISTTRDIVDKGRKKEHLELELIARDLQERADRITVPVPASSATGEDGNDQSLLHLGTQCKSIATELLAVLEKLKLRKGGNRWDSFLQVLKTEWKSSEIDALRQRLERIAEAVNARFTESQQRKVLVRLDELHVENLRLEMSRASDIVDLKTKYVRSHIIPASISLFFLPARASLPKAFSDARSLKQRHILMCAATLAGSTGCLTELTREGRTILMGEDSLKSCTKPPLRDYSIAQSKSSSKPSGLIA